MQSRLLEKRHVGHRAQEEQSPARRQRTWICREEEVVCLDARQDRVKIRQVFCDGLCVSRRHQRVSMSGFTVYARSSRESLGGTKTHPRCASPVRASPILQAILLCRLERGPDPPTSSVGVGEVASVGRRGVLEELVKRDGCWSERR